VQGIAHLQVNVVAKQKLVQLIILPRVLLGLANTITNKDSHSKWSRNSKPTSNKRGGLCNLHILETPCHKVFLNPRHNFLLKPKDKIQNNISSITISFRIRSQISSFLDYTMQNTNILKNIERGRRWKWLCNIGISKEYNMDGK
jgi:hypothetical protein